MQSKIIIKYWWHCHSCYFLWRKK